MAQTIYAGGAAGNDETCGTADDNPQLFGPDAVCGASGPDGIPCNGDEDPADFGPDGICGTADDIADDNPQLFGPDALCGTADDTSSDLSCLQSGLLNTTIDDGESPALTGIFFYLVTSKNCRREATLGLSGAEIERSSLGPCP